MWSWLLSSFWPHLLLLSPYPLHSDRTAPGPSFLRAFARVAALCTSLPQMLSLFLPLLHSGLCSNVTCTKSLSLTPYPNSQVLYSSHPVVRLSSPKGSRHRHGVWDARYLRGINASAEERVEVGLGRGRNGTVIWGAWEPVLPIRDGLGAKMTRLFQLILLSSRWRLPQEQWDFGEASLCSWGRSWRDTQLEAISWPPSLSWVASPSLLKVDLTSTTPDLVFFIVLSTTWDNIGYSLVYVITVFLQKGRALFILLCSLRLESCSVNNCGIRDCLLNIFLYSTSYYSPNDP